jgi:S-adenosylmethionine:tRNA ribosyltransferase-isomerase
VLLSEFYFDLPVELIAQEPAADRAGARMLHLGRRSGEWHDRSFHDLVRLLRTDDLLVFNKTRVFPARLFGHRAGVYAQPVSQKNAAAKEFLRGKVEVLLTRQLKDNEWLALVHPGRKIAVGEKLFFGEGAEGPELEAEVIGRGTSGERTLRFSLIEDFFGILERIGHIPLPPYINRPDTATDRERYQTVFARDRGSVAAPTAGLHFTPEIMRAIKERGIETAELTLHVGLGTFQPLRHDRVEDNKLHREAYSISPETAAAINAAKSAGRRVVAVGTTTVRTLEYAASLTQDGSIAAASGEVDIFIYPGFEFRVTDALLTNFHLPRSSLLMLVSAFAGRENVLRAYHHAVQYKYRFFSYGDCMFVE